VSTTVPVRDAATVVLLRDGDAGIETWLLTRVAQMAFAAGMSVFPGGRVDERDAALPMAGDTAALAARFDCAPELARALVGAAVRETFEETGVLLTRPAADLSPEVAAQVRADVEEGRRGFGDVLAEYGLAIDTDALRPWARWITPAGERRRYDARFFVGALPDGVEPQDVTSESSAAGWLPVRIALEQGLRGERGLMPPTQVTLNAIAAHPTVADVLAAAAAQPLTPVEPRLQVAPDGTPSVLLPDGTVVEIPKALLA
jgi:8-oxo-dGTP pyrophosphatase MutT (NUDIX family)